MTPWTIHSRILERVVFPFSRGIFRAQGSNPGLPHFRQILYQLSHKGSPGIGKMHSIASRFLNPFFPGTLPEIEISFLYWALSMLLDTCARFSTHIAPVLKTPWRWVIWCLLQTREPVQQGGFLKRSQESLGFERRYALLQKCVLTSKSRHLKEQECHT